MSSRRRSKKLKTSAIRTTDDLLHEKGIGKWLSLDAEDLMTQDGDVRYSRKASSGRTRLVDGRYELPFVDIERDEQVDYQRQFDMFNSMLDHDTRVGQTRRQHQYYIHSGVSEDSDYTSDVNYPIGGGQPQRPNSSASYHHNYGSSSSAAHRSPRHHHHQQQHHQLATPQRSLNSSRENSYEKDDDYRHNGQSSYYPPPPTSTSSTSQQQQQRRHHRQLPQTHGLSSNHSSSSQQTQQQQQQYLTAQSQSRQFSHRSRTSITSSSQQEQTQEYWDDPRDYETDPLYYNSRPQSFKPYSAYRRHDSWDDGYNSYRKEDSYSRQYTDDYEDAQDDYCQPSHNYSKRLKNNRRGTHSLERQDTLYHDDIPGDYHIDVHDSNSRLYDNDRYSSTSSSHNQQHQRQHSLQKDSGYDQYSLDYGDYGEDTSFYGNDDSTIPQASASSTIDQYDQYEEDNRYSYDSQDWGTEADSRDHYSTTSSTKPPKRLPQIPTQKQPSLHTDSYSEDAYHDTAYDDAAAYDDATYDDYGMASTADDTYYSNKDYDDDDTYDDDARTIVPESIPPTTATAAVPAIATSSTQQSSPYKKQQQYPTEQYQNQTQAEVPLTQPQMQQQQQTTTTQKHVKNTQQSYQAQETHQNQNQQYQEQPVNLQEQHHHDQSQDYYDTSVTYENQTWYDESWGYNGYYDEAGNFISYDSTSYYDESGNLVTADQDQYAGYYGDDTTGSAATAIAAVDQTYPQTVPTSTSQQQQPPQQSRADQQYNHNTGNTTEIESLPTTQQGSLDQYDNTDYYYSGGDQDYNYDDYYGYGDGKDYSSYDAGDYVDESGEYHQDHGIPSASDTATTADQYNNSKPSQYQSSSSKKSQLHSLQSQSSVEYNYAYQSAENLSSSLPYEDALSQAAKTSITTTTTVIAASVTTGSTVISSSSHLDRANSSTRRASFRRQVTRDYGLDGGPDSRSQSFDAPVHPLDVPPSSTNANIEKSETFRNGIKVTVQDTIDLGLGYSMSIEDDNYNPADPQWQEGYDFGNEDWKSSEDWNKSEEDRRTYEDQKSHESQEQGYETQDTSRDNGPVHMDSLESTTSDQAARDPEANDKFEAQYWQKQQERIAKQATLTAQDSFGYDYDIGKGAGAAFFEPVVDMNDPTSNSVIDQVDHHHVLSRMNSEEEWATGRGSKKNSLDIEQEEWLSGLDRKGSQRSIRSNLMSRQESITLDTHPEEDDEYLIGGPPGTEDRIRNRKISADSTGLSETAAKLAMLNEIEDDTMISILEDPLVRKSSLEIAPGLEKAIKSVSFEEDPPKMIAPERQTKGMTPREKWLWSMNRICSQLAVS